MHTLLVDGVQLYDSESQHQMLCRWSDGLTGVLCCWGSWQWCNSWWNDVALGMWEPSLQGLCPTGSLAEHQQDVKHCWQRRTLCEQQNKCLINNNNTFYLEAKDKMGQSAHLGWSPGSLNENSCCCFSSPCTRQWAAAPFGPSVL